jgi:DNA uptake protein ComE-like DNA-binding protein
MTFREFWHGHLRPFLVFSRGERNGVLFLFLLLNLAWIIPVYLPRKPLALSPVEVRLIDSARKAWNLTGTEGKRYGITENNRQGGEGLSVSGSPARLLFRPFDPNTADEQTWVAMGIPPRTIRIIHRYIEKGGRFRAPEELRKIYGLTDQQFRMMRAWIRIAPPAANPGQGAGRGTQYSTGSRTDAAYARKIPSAYRKDPDFRGQLDINRADSADWEALPGIGPTLARRIVRYREALGGFHMPQQVAETYGLPDSVFQLIRGRLSTSPGHPVRELRVNTDDAASLAAHPYVTRKLAGLITAYRSRHGPFRSTEELLAIPLVNDSLLNRLRPYLSLN